MNNIFGYNMRGELLSRDPIFGHALKAVLCIGIKIGEDG